MKWLRLFLYCVYSVSICCIPDKAFSPNWCGCFSLWLGTSSSTRQYALDGAWLSQAQLSTPTQQFFASHCLLFRIRITLIHQAFVLSWSDLYIRHLYMYFRENLSNLFPRKLDMVLWKWDQLAVTRCDCGLDAALLFECIVYCLELSLPNRWTSDKWSAQILCLVVPWGSIVLKERCGFATTWNL